MLAKNILDLLEKHDTSLAKLSRETNIPRSTLNSWLKGRSPNLEQLNKVAEFFNTTIDFLAFSKKQSVIAPALLYKGEVKSGSFEIVVRRIAD